MTPTQSLVKAVLWRLLTICITIVVLYYISDSITIATGLGLCELIGKTILYYVYDRLWNRLEK